MRKCGRSFEIGDTIFRIHYWLSKHPTANIVKLSILATIILSSCTSRLLRLSKRLVLTVSSWFNPFRTGLDVGASSGWGSSINRGMPLRSSCLSVLDKVKAKGKYLIWKSFRKALRSVWNKKDIAVLEQQLARYKDEFRLACCIGLEVIICEVHTT